MKTTSRITRFSLISVVLGVLVLTAFWLPQAHAQEVPDGANIFDAETGLAWTKVKSLNPLSQADTKRPFFWCKAK